MICISFYRIIINMLLLICEFVGIVKLLVVIVGSKKTSPSKVYIFCCAISVIIPIIVAYGMYFSGSYRVSPLTEHSIESTIEYVLSVANDDNYQIIDDCENPEFSYSVILLQEYLIDDVNKDLYTKERVYKEKKYYIEAVHSNRGSSFLSNRHTGYEGRVFFEVNEDYCGLIEYKINRKIDESFGFFYAPPIFSDYSLNI